MTTEEAAQILRHMYNSAPLRNKTLAVHLFGIKYGKDIRASELKADEIAAEARVGKNRAAKVGPAIDDGIKLGKYVELTPQGHAWVARC